MILYHGTLTDVAEPVQRGEEDLFGYVDKTSSLSANLTDSEWTAYQFARLPGGRRGRTAKSLLMIFEIPSDLVEEHGTIPGYPGSRCFSTKETVPPEDLPDRYLENLGITREDAVNEVREGYRRFYRVSSRYLKSVEEL